MEKCKVKFLKVWSQVKVKWIVVKISFKNSSQLKFKISSEKKPHGLQAKKVQYFLWLFHCQQPRFQSEIEPALYFFIDPLRLIIRPASDRFILREVIAKPSHGPSREILSSMPQNGPENKAVNYLRRCIWKLAVQYRASSWPRENWKENKSTISVINWLNMERQNEWNHSPNNEALKKIINDRFVLFNTQAIAI